MRKVVSVMGRVLLNVIWRRLSNLRTAVEQGDRVLVVVVIGWRGGVGSGSGWPDINVINMLISSLFLVRV